MLDCNVAGCLLSFVLFDTFAKSCGVKVSHIDNVMYLVLWILALLDKRRVLDMSDPYVAAVFKYLIVFCLIPSPNLAVRFFVGAAYATSSLLTVIYLFRIHHGLLFRII